MPGCLTFGVGFNGPPHLPEALLEEEAIVDDVLVEPSNVGCDEADRFEVAEVDVTFVGLAVVDDAEVEEVRLLADHLSGHARGDLVYKLLLIIGLHLGSHLTQRRHVHEEA